MARNIASIIVGIATAAFIVWSIQSINFSLFPIPASIDQENPEEMKAYIKGLPDMAYFIVLLSHLLGAFFGAFVACKIADTHFKYIALGIGGFIMIMGLFNLFSYPHPIWFTIIDLLIYLPAAMAGLYLAGKYK